MFWCQLRDWCCSLYNCFFHKLIHQLFDDKLIFFTWKILFWSDEHYGVHWKGRDLGSLLLEKRQKESLVVFSFPQICWNNTGHNTTAAYWKDGTWTRLYYFGRLLHQSFSNVCCFCELQQPFALFFCRFQQSVKKYFTLFVKSVCAVSHITALSHFRRVFVCLATHKWFANAASVTFCHSAGLKLQMQM